MKHGIKLRKLQRTPSHRWALLRNLVSALLHHESIKTTLPKAKEAARMAEKIITLGKKGTDPARRSAMAFLMPSHSYNPAATHNGPIPPPRPTGYPSYSLDPNADPEDFVPPTTLLPKLFSTLSERYADRPGGYTRIHKFGKRSGDNAPHAILELVDGPRDLKFEMTARAVGRESAQYAEARGGVDAALAEQGEEWAGLRDRTRLGLDKVLKYRGEEGRRELEERAKEWTDRLMAEERASGGLRRLKGGMDAVSRADLARTPEPHEGRRYKSGERMSGMAVAHTGLGLARADLGRTFRNGSPDKRPRFINQRPTTDSTSISIDP